MKKLPIEVINENSLIDRIDELRETGSVSILANQLAIQVLEVLIRLYYRPLAERIVEWKGSIANIPEGGVSFSTYTTTHDYNFSIYNDGEMVLLKAVPDERNSVVTFDVNSIEEFENKLHILMGS